MHSEIEAFFEERAKETAIMAVKFWKTSQRTTLVIIGLLAFSGLTMEAPPEKLNGPQGITDISTRIDGAMKSYIHKLNQNHGIKEENILQILYPIGFQPQDFDSVWLNTINSFGKMRGETAHTSIKTQQPINPKDEHDLVKYLVSGIAEVDKKINSLL